MRALQAYHSGNGLLNRGMFDLAAAEYRQFLSIHPKHEKASLARYGLAVSLFRLGKFEAALPELTLLRSADTFEYAAEVAAMTGQCHLAAGQYDPAGEAFKSVLRNHPKHAVADDAAAQLTEALYRGGNYKTAAKQADRFGARWPESPHRDRAGYFGGLAEMEQQAYDAAAKLFSDLRAKDADSSFAAHAGLLLAQCRHHNKDLKAAALEYRKVLGQAGHPFRPGALLGLGTVLQQQDRAAEAGELLDDLIEKHPESRLADAARQLRGRVWFDLGDFERAARAFTRVEKRKGPQAADAAYWSAKCKLRLNDCGGAAHDLKRAIARYPDSALLPEMCYDRAIALLRCDKHKAAGKALSAFCSRFPDHALAADALYSLATIAHQQGAHEVCNGHVRVFLDRHAGHELSPKIAFLSAENAYASGNYGQAATAYRRFLDRHGSDALAGTARYRLGMALYRLDELEEARRLLTEIAEGGAGREVPGAVNLALGNIHFRLEAWPQASRFLNAYVSGGLDAPMADDALLKLGLALQRQAEYGAALEQYDRLLARFAGSIHRPQALFERGQALVALKRLDQATEAFEELIALEDASRFRAPACKHLASIALRRGDLEGATERFAQVAKAAQGEEEGEALFQQARVLNASDEFVTAEKVLRACLDRFPSHPRMQAVKANLAIALARQNKHAGALEFIAQINPSKLGPELAAATQYEQAWCLQAMGKHDDAASAYRKLLQSTTEGDLHAHALLDLASIEIARERHGDAIKLLEGLRLCLGRPGLDVSPAVAEQGLYKLGTCLFHVGKYDEASEVLHDYVEAHADSKLLGSASFFCGEAFFRLDKHGQAVQHFERVASGAKADSVYGPSLLRLGACYASGQRWARSEEVFTEFLEQFGDDEQWYQAEFGTGWARENQGRLEEAIAAYRRVVDRHRGETAARAQFQIGQCLFAKGQHKDAVRELLKVDILYAYPEWSAAALYEAGRCFEKLAQTAEARQQFKTIVEKYGDTRWAVPASEHMATVSAELPPGR